MPEYRRNHYVTQWYQKRFIPDDGRARNFHYLDLKPDTIVSSGTGRRYKCRPLNQCGIRQCFCELDLYTTRFGDWESTEIEEKIFGKIDSDGRKAVKYFAAFEHPSASGDALNNLLIYMSTQKLRTPKGINHFAQSAGLQNKNQVLIQIQKFQQIFCTYWSEAVWNIVDASESDTKFIISDHPVTVYNKGCFPGSIQCKGFNDPDIGQTGTHTLFPLSLNKLLILTNLSWVRNPYSKPVVPRPNLENFRSTMFSFLDIQTGRMLNEEEVREINFIMKLRAYRYVAAAEEDWLYPERFLSTTRWDKLGRGYLLMPDPRSMVFSTQSTIGYKGGGAKNYDAYGRTPDQKEYMNKSDHEIEWNTFLAFQGEFARKFGPRRRGRSYIFDRLDDEIDSPDFHEYHLELETKYKPPRSNRRASGKKKKVRKRRR